MRLFLLLILSATLLFGGYWVFAAQMIERQGTALLARSAQLGGQMQPVTGFPRAFRTTIEAPLWRSRDGLSGWSAAELALAAASHQPNRISADFPTAQVLRLGGTDMAVDTQHMTGALALGADQSLRAVELQLGGAEFGPAAPLSAAGQSALNLRQIEGARYAVEAQINDLSLAPGTLTLIGSETDLPDLVARIAITAEAEFAHGLPLRTPWPDLQALDLTGAILDWGALQASMTGRLARSASGTMDGQIQLELQDWRPFHALLLAQGALPPDAAMLAGMFLAGQAAPGTHAVTLPLELRAQVLSLGPFALARLPQF